MIALNPEDRARIARDVGAVLIAAHEAARSADTEAALVALLEVRNACIRAAVTIRAAENAVRNAA